MLNNTINQKYHYIMLKEHKVTGLLYLCYHVGTKQSCYKYCGSGIYWQRHLKVHGKLISTTILAECTSQQNAKEVGMYYTKLYDVVKSDKFANFVEENANTRVVSTKISHRLSVLSKQQRLLKTGRTPAEKAAAKRLKEHYRNGNFTPAQRRYHENQSAMQQGKSMRERLKNSLWVSPNTGRNMKQRIGDNNWVSPQSKPFKLIINNVCVLFFNNTTEFCQKTKYAAPMILKLRKIKTYTVKRNKLSKHIFQNGDVIQFEPV